MCCCVVVVLKCNVLTLKGILLSLSKVPITCTVFAAIHTFYILNRFHSKYRAQNDTVSNLAIKQQHVKAIPAERLLPWQTPGCCPSRWGGAAPTSVKIWRWEAYWGRSAGAWPRTPGCPPPGGVCISCRCCCVEGSSCCRAPLCDYYSPPAAAAVARTFPPAEAYSLRTDKTDCCAARFLHRSR